jgi:hypothetical protein
MFSFFETKSRCGMASLDFTFKTRVATCEGALKEEYARLPGEDVRAEVERSEIGKVRFKHGKNGLC